MEVASNPTNNYVSITISSEKELDSFRAMLYILRYRGNAQVFSKI